MMYITGLHALNITCSLDTCGDWHQSALKWNALQYKDSDEMFFKSWGIEEGKIIPEHTGVYNVANHIRALLDLLQMGNYAAAQGMKNDYICNDKYTMLIFEKVMKMRLLSNWKEIDRLMGKEYKMEWVNYKKERYICI